MRLGIIAGYTVVSVTLVATTSLALSGLYLVVEALLDAGYSKYVSFAFVGAGVALMGVACAMWLNGVGEKIHPDRWVYIIQFQNDDTFAFVPVVHRSPDLAPYMAIEMAERTMDMQGQTKEVLDVEPLVHGPFPMFMEDTL